MVHGVFIWCSLLWRWSSNSAMWLKGLITSLNINTADVLQKISSQNAKISTKKYFHINFLRQRLIFHIVKSKERLKNPDDLCSIYRKIKAPFLFKELPFKMFNKTFWIDWCFFFFLSCKNSFCFLLLFVYLICWTGLFVTFIKVKTINCTHKNMLDVFVYMHKYVHVRCICVYVSSVWMINIYTWQS